jgi:cystinosin
MPMDNNIDSHTAVTTESTDAAAAADSESAVPTALATTTLPTAGEDTQTTSLSSWDENDDCRSISRGLCLLLALGFTMGCVSSAWQWHNTSDTENNDKGHDNNMRSWLWTTFSQCLGYTYVSMWSVSFYPQLRTNYIRQSTQGLSVDFASLNVLGFSCYTIYNVALYYSPSIRAEYRARHNSTTTTTIIIPVQFNDVLFAGHALLVSSLTMGQILWYNRQRPQFQRPQSIMVIGLLAATLAFLVGYPMVLVAAAGAQTSSVVVTGVLSPLDYVYVLSYIKMTITLVKYTPQLWLNWRRKSTIGWSVWQIILDFGGGLLSVGQLLVDCVYIHHDWSGVTGNLAKFALGLCSMLFDVLFLYQHYVLYGDDSAAVTNPSSESSVEGGEVTTDSEPLLSTAERDSR